MIGQKKIPDGWVEIELGKIAKIQSGGTPSRSNKSYWNGNIPWIKIKDIQSLYVDASTEFITEAGLHNSSTRIFPKGTVLFTIFATIGRIGILNIDAATNQAIAGITPITSINKMFLIYSLQELANSIMSQGKGVAQKNVNQTILRETKIPLPPRPEQDRIVAKVDALMEQVETMQKSLERIPQLLKDFRQKVLTQAVTGKLNLGIGENNQISEFKRFTIENLVKSLKSDIRTGPFGSALKKEEHQLEGVPVWGIESIGKEGKFTGKNKIFVTEEKAKSLKSFEVEAGNVIISRSGTVGELCVLPENIPYGLISTNLMKIVLDEEVIISKFFCWVIKADPRILTRLEELCKGSTRLFLTQTILQKLEFNIPNLDEQNQIIRRVELLFDTADMIEENYQTLKNKIDILPQAILHKAFKGELVEQLPTDGDARELLREIEGLKGTIKPKKTKTFSIEEETLGQVAEQRATYLK